ncbi:Hsp20 family protein [Clostridium baratii]|uniref:Heat shock protein n=1 Tax=Clostridium baratii TaxID=1561 RepID=A0A174UR96_9CLOT|nr:Hsp20 family protein [Clostridium baratii]CUQ22310.1 heat shock protein [Clostridium baratii]
MNRNPISGGNDFANIFTQTFNAFINNNNIIDNVVNNLFNSGFSYNFNQGFDQGVDQRFNNMNSTMSVNMIDKEDKYLIEGNFPGIDKDNIRIDYKDGYIYLNVRNKRVYSNGYNMMMTVMQFGDEFSREFYVPEADATRLKVSYRNYKLKLELPKYRDVIEGTSSNDLLENDSVIIDVVDYKEE